MQKNNKTTNHTRLSPLVSKYLEDEIAKRSRNRTRGNNALLRMFPSALWQVYSSQYNDYTPSVDRNSGNSNLAMRYTRSASPLPAPPSTATPPPPPLLPPLPPPNSPRLSNKQNALQLHSEVEGDQMPSVSTPRRNREIMKLTINLPNLHGGKGSSHIQYTTVKTDVICEQPIKLHYEYLNRPIRDESADSISGEVGSASFREETENVDE
ncbi:hypothetical protein CAPTEDRAFT_202608 [Capitella teleta]|uniref:Uncharacterized protein n=1 Tax=Capitella teleta TaxID=283909 RepID=R7U760_CAPTE|nr:hypothetical protein CAPTEDRAFT_205940 [Capitella teleta]ELU06213.1 hypothetical protein CAPTEDRAFT_202608 [Capitella teleta]|eukprot:ELT98975.1 hypothetical protein CAPTEDRAFT_205940 [Capitella teleta]